MNSIQVLSGLFFHFVVHIHSINQILNSFRSVYFILHSCLTTLVQYEIYRTQLVEYLVNIGEFWNVAFTACSKLNLKSTFAHWALSPVTGCKTCNQYPSQWPIGNRTIIYICKDTKPCITCMPRSPSLVRKNRESDDVFSFRQTYIIALFPTGMNVLQLMIGDNSQGNETGLGVRFRILCY